MTVPSVSEHPSVAGCAGGQSVVTIGVLVGVEGTIESVGAAVDI
jgi:hypothetical protein